MRSVIRKQLTERNIGFERILFNSIDTITNNDYYSNSAASPNGLNRIDKSGRNFAGLFYPEDNALQYVRK